MSYLSIVIPAYNEAERLPETLASVQEYLGKQSFTAEVLVVDDGSKDATVAKVAELQKTFPELQIITNAENKGKGGVVRQGMLAATGEHRLFMDADHSTPITELDKLLPFIGKFDVIIGSRYLKKDSIKLKQPLVRRLVSRIGNMLIQRSVLPGIVDTQCGFKLFCAEAAQNAFTRQSMNGWAFDVEVLTICRLHNCTIKEVAVDWYDDADSKLRATHAAARSFQDLNIIKRKVREGAYQ